ncbi:class II aldolase/adducin family protein [Paracoccus sp. (in: a-proteobacteria)]|uniref:class II aldolase/adducin family protein n=1 Tax=Paracoccus sp. TaxID=267 RepID=UPI003A84D5D8
MLVTPLRRPEGRNWDRFLSGSARIGRDIRLVQAAGGNTSVKTGDGVMWIKASGTWLSEADTRGIMVPVDLASMRADLASGRLTEDDIPRLTGRAQGAEPMRASVETPFHALFHADYVLHVHCTATLAHAVAADARDRLTERLTGLNWIWQPYVKPGVPLTFALKAREAAQAEVVILGNHGLIVAADSMMRAERLIHEVGARLDPGLSDRPAAFIPPEQPLTGSGYGPAPVGAVHALAFDDDLLALAGNSAIAPDFVVFFGPRIPVLPATPDLPDRLQALAGQPCPLDAVVIVPGHGVLIRDDAMRGTADLLRGYHLTLAGFLATGGGTIRHFTNAESAGLLNWDAEKYRQSLNARGADGNA